ncbi:MAG: FAD:protein FMN transferase [Clostridia bacterium]|nr:FAD:protein FMN transferase [Clostridia bacterium]
MKRIIQISLSVIVLIIIYLLFSTFVLKNDHDEFNVNQKGEIRFFAFNTIIDITINDHYSDALNEEVTSYILALEENYSRYVENSQVSKLNLEKHLKVTGEFKSILDYAKQYYDLSNHKFDVTMGPIIDLWKIGQDGENVPSQEKINDTLKYVGMDGLSFKDGEVVLKEGMSLDLGGILKGYAADGVVKILKERHVESGLINLGGNLFVVGMNNGSEWRVGVRNPFGSRDDYVGIISAYDQSIVTSGPYEKYFIQDHHRYHHIFDALTGYPVENEIESVTVLSNLSVDGDALTTTVFTMGIVNGLNLLNELEGIEGIIITKNREVFITDGLKSIYEHRDASFTVQ